MNLAHIGEEKRLAKATAMLLYSEPFYGTLLLRMPRVAVGPEVCEVAATDGKTLFYNPQGTAKLNFDQLKTMLMHEASHNGLGHHVRMIGKDAELANMAGDHVVNLILQEGGYVPIPGWLCDPRFKGQTYEHVYAVLERERQRQTGGGGGKRPSPNGGGQQQQSGQGQGKQGQQPCPPGGQNGTQPKAARTPGGFGQILPCDPKQKHTQEQEWKLAVEQAAAAARSAGKLPAHLAKLVEELRESKVDWRELLRAFIAETIPADFTWSRPSKRTLSQGIYLPSQVKEGLDALVFVIDNSGSCTQAVPAFASEIAAVHQDLKPSKITVLCHDTEVYNIGEFLPGDEITFRLKGGGGTDFRPVFDMIDEMQPPPRAVVFLTDLYGPLPMYQPSYPVLFVCTSKQIAPWGETVRMHLY